MSSSTLSKAASWATVVTALIAVAALCIAVWQIRASQQTQREASARDAFKEYLKLAMEKPELAEARLDKEPKFEKVRSSYGWFVSYFLFSAEQIHQSFPDDAEWAAALASQVCQHRIYLRGAEYQKTQRAHYAPSFATFVDDSLGRCVN